MLFGSRYIENINTINEFAFCTPAPDKYFIHIVVTRVEKDTHNLQVLSFEKGDQKFVMYDKVEEGETMYQAFQRVFNKGYGFKNFDSARIESLMEYANDSKGIRRPRFTINVRVSGLEQCNESCEGHKLVWTTIPGPFEILKELTKQKVLGTAFVPTAQANLPQHISKFGGLPFLPESVLWPECEFCGKAMDFVCQFSKEDFPTMKVPTPETSHLLAFTCLNGNDSMRDMGVKTLWAKSGDTAISEIPNVTFPENRYQNPPKESKAQPMNLIDCVSFTNYKHPELARLFNELPDERQEYYFDRYLPYEGTKVDGEPRFIQNDEYPVCKVCGNKMEFWGQLSSEEPITRLLKRDFADHKFMWGDVGSVYLYYCRDWCTDEVTSIMQCS